MSGIQSAGHSGMQSGAYPAATPNLGERLTQYCKAIARLTGANGACILLFHAEGAWALRGNWGFPALLTNPSPVLAFQPAWSAERYIWTRLSALEEPTAEARVIGGITVKQYVGLPLTDAEGTPLGRVCLVSGAEGAPLDEPNQALDALLGFIAKDIGKSAEFAPGDGISAPLAEVSLRETAPEQPEPAPHPFSFNPGPQTEDATIFPPEFMPRLTDHEPDLQPVVAQEEAPTEEASPPPAAGGAKPLGHIRAIFALASRPTDDLEADLQRYLALGTQYLALPYGALCRFQPASSTATVLAQVPAKTPFTWTTLEPLLTKVNTTRKLVAGRDAASLARLIDTESQLPERIEAGLFVPVWVEQHLFGVLAYVSTAERTAPFTAADTAWLEMLALGMANRIQRHQEQDVYAEYKTRLQDLYQRAEQSLVDVTRKLDAVEETLDQERAEKIRAHVDLKDTRIRFASLIKNLYSAVLLEDENRQIALTNDAFCALFRIPVPPDQMIGMDCSTAAEDSKMMFADPETFVQRVREILAAREVVASEEIALADGHIFERDYIPIFNDQVYLGHLWVYRDITERKQAEAAVHTLNETLENRVVERTRQLEAANDDLKNEIQERIKAEAEAARKTEQLQSFSNKLKTLHQLRTGAYESREELLEQYLSTGCTLFDMSAGFVSQLDQDRDQLTVIHSMDQRVEPGTIIDASRSLCAGVIKGQKTITNGVIDQTALVQDLPIAAELGYRAYMAAPLLVEGAPYGALCFFSEEHRDHHPLYEAEIIQLMAESVGKIIEVGIQEQERKEAEKEIRRLNTELEHRVVERTLQLEQTNNRLATEVTERKDAQWALHRTAERLRVLNAIQQRVLEIESPQMIAQWALENMRQLIPFQRASVLAFDTDAQQAETLGILSDIELALDRLTQMPMSMFTENIDMRDIMVVQNLKEKTQLSEPERHLLSKGINSYFTVPILAQHNLIGVINVASSDVAAFKPEQIEIAREVADLIAISLNKMRLETARKQYQAELIGAKEEAEEMNRLKTSFLANMSHEIRTPLTAIIGFADLLTESVKNEDLDFVRMIYKSGRRLMETLNSVLDLAQLEGQSMKLSPAPTDVVEQIKDTVSILTPIAEEKSLTIRLQSSNPVKAEVDRGALSRVLMNLIGNAIKFTEQGGVTVRVAEDRQFVWIQVEDTGIGMDADFLAYLYDEFRQESTGFARSYEGSGLGLTITKRLVDLMKGQIEVQSTKAEGTVFTVRLPLVLAPGGE